MRGSVRVTTPATKSLYREKPLLASQRWGRWGWKCIESLPRSCLVNSGRPLLLSQPSLWKGEAKESLVKKCMIIGRTPKKTRAGVPTSQSLLMGRCYTQGPHTSHSVPYPTRQAHPYDRVARTGGFPEELPPNSASRSTAARKQARCPQLPSNA